MDALIVRIFEKQISGINVRISELESAKTSNGGKKLKLIEARIDELNLAKMRLQQERTRELERLRRIFESGVCCDPADRIMKLQLRNEISKSILTGEEFSVEVALVDPTTNNIVEIGRESSAKVELVVLNEGLEDDLTGEAFEDKIIHEMEGKKPLLKGNPQVKLQRGKANLDKISFRHRRKKNKQRRFRLGARIANQIFDGVWVKEAMTETFTVKDYRDKYHRKHKNPLLSDEVSRLKNIRRYGKIDKVLKGKKIETVEDFLIQHLRNPESLKKIVNLREKKKWEAIVSNARACQNDGKMYCYVNHEQKTGVVFNVLGEVLQLYLINQYATTAVSPENHQDLARELLSSARIHWEDVRTFYDKNALEEYLIGKSSRRSKRWKKFLNVFKVSFGGSKRPYAPCFDDDVWRPENIIIDEVLRDTLLMTETPTRRETTANHAQTCTLSDTPMVLSEIDQPENGIISYFWYDPNYFPPEY